MIIRTDMKGSIFLRLLEILRLMTRLVIYTYMVRNKYLKLFEQLEICFSLILHCDMFISLN